MSALKSLSQTIHWFRAGMPLPPPAAVKRRLIRAVRDKHKLGVFVETGTFKGDTLAAMAADGMECHSVELSDEYFARAKTRFQGKSDVHLYHGDSGAVLPEIVAGLKRPALFWLDGHYSAGETARGALESPVSAELEAVFASPVAGHVILIDDMQDFTGKGGYPELGSLLASIAKRGGYRATINANILILEPL